MCGIVGYIGKNNALSKLIKGLKVLEYRGYDSAGVSYFFNNSIKIIKSVGKIEELEKKLDYHDSSYVGIGHTRWATHGGVNINNCHPHKSGNVVLVHNGIIENYQELKKILVDKGYEFYGETDSEVAACYIDFLYHKNKEQNLVQVLNRCAEIFEGSYAIVGMIEGLEQQLFVMKKDSPLVIGLGNNETYIASDALACSDEVDSFIFLDDKDVGIISGHSVKIYHDGIKKKHEITKINSNLKKEEIRNFKHYMLKEIKEQVSLVEMWNKTKLNYLDELSDLRGYDKIHIIGCGTAYHAGVIGKYLLEEYLDKEIQVFIASEYRYQKLFINKNTLVIFVSQSGETADTIACLKRVLEYQASTLGIVNVENSSIARIVDNVIYTKAGPEIAVASTKAYLSQIYIFSLLAIKAGIINKKLDFDVVKNTYLELPKLINNLLEYDYDKIIEKILGKKDIFYLGRNIDYVTMMEGALKLKEISYIHAEAFQAGELKHGTISLIENGMPVLALLSKEDLVTKTLSNVEEVKSRGAYIILLVKEGLISKLHLDGFENIIILPNAVDFIQPIINIIPLQMIAYTTARKLGVDIDKPRNLAKSVTVE